MSLVFRTEHEKKYDRQLRLWGTYGQILLENTRLCILGASVVGSEILKNLCLANVGEFEIVDDQRIQMKDVETNFFVEKEETNKKRGEVVMKWLLEMNPDVREYFDKFTFVIITQIFSSSILLKISNYLYSKNIPLLITTSIGLLGSLRVCIKEHNIVDTKPDSDINDLYLYPSQLEQFKELSDYIDTFKEKLDGADSNIHSHIPFAVILGLLLKKYIAANNALPTTYVEQEQFKESIRKASFDYGSELNFVEAMKFAYKAYSKPRISPDLAALFENPSPAITPFWIIIRALAEFYKKTGLLPVTGIVPDMHADTTSYVTLCKIYKSKHQEHLNIIKNLIPESERSLVDDDYLERFIKNAAAVKCCFYRSLEKEYTMPNLVSISEDEEEKPYIEGTPRQPKTSKWYITMRALELFYDKNNRFPESDDDSNDLVSIATKYLSDRNINVDVVADCMSELWNGSELHTISSIMGGVAAQEATKIIVQQYTPINNTFIYEGIYCSSETWEL